MKKQTWKEVKPLKPLQFQFISRADMAVDVRNIPPIIEKINEIIKALSDAQEFIKKGKV